MPDIEKCTTCNGEGYCEVLTNQHDDKKEIIPCPTCNGKGTVNVMTKKEEQDYWDDYW